MRGITRLAIISCFPAGLMIVPMITQSIPAENTNNRTISDLPYDIHLNWQHNPSTTMTIVWETTASTTGSTVKYGLDTTYGSIATGTTDNQGTNGLIHIVEITGLLPATTYHYICGDDTGGWSTDSTFMTAPIGRWRCSIDDPCIKDAGKTSQYDKNHDGNRTIFFFHGTFPPMVFITMLSFINV